MKTVLFGFCMFVSGIMAAAEVAVPPFIENFDEPEACGQFTILNVNNDDATFEFKEGVARVRFSLSGPTDDWLVLPPMQLKGGYGYTFSCDAYAQHVRYPERFEVMVASEPTAEALSKGESLVRPTVINQTVENPYRVETIFTPETDGVYYIGIHGCSDENRFYLNIDNVAVSDGISGNSPGQVIDSDVERDPSGALSASVYYTAPKLNFAGKPLAALDGVKIYRDNELVVTQTPVPGEVMTYIDNDVTAGEHTYMLVPFNADGEGEPVKLTVFVGFNRPAAVTGLKAVVGEHDGQAVMTWSPVTSDITGVVYPEGSVTYNVLRVYGFDQILLKEGLTETSFVDDFCTATSPQTGVYYTVVPVSSAGEGVPTNTPYMCLGAPYTVPFAESFADGEPSYALWVTDGPGSWSLPGDYDTTLFASQDGDNGMVSLYSTDVSKPSEIITGRISLADMDDAVLTFHTLAYSSTDGVNRNRMEVAVDCGDGNGFKTVATFDDNSTIDGNARWIPRKVQLGQWAGSDIRVAFRFITVTHPISALDNIAIKQQWEHNIAVGALNLPASMTAGVESTIPFSFTNIGTKDATGYSAILYRDGEEVSTIIGPDLEPDQSVTISFTQTPSSMWDKGANYFAVIDYDLDGDPDDNATAETLVLVKTQPLPVPGVITATVSNADDLTLSWTAPVIPDDPPVEITDDLSTLTPFSTGVSGSQLGTDDYMGDWSVIDGDGLASINISGVNFTNSGTPMAFIVFNGAATDVEWEMFEDHGGDGNMFMSLCAVNGRNDDWLVSPRLCGEAQTVSFFVKSILPDMPEMYEVYYSTTGKEKADFEKIVDARNASAQWSEIKVDLPAGATYFAVRYCSLDHYALLIDDITYTPASPVAGLELTGYNLYRNGVLVNDSPLPNTSMSGVSCDTGDRMEVTAVYNNGESAPSAPYIHGNSGIGAVGASDVTISTAPGQIAVMARQGDVITVADIAGRIHYRSASTGSDTIAVAPGIYIVTVGSTTAKVAVP